MIDLDTGERLHINAFLSILLLSTNFYAFLLPTTCLLLGIYFSPLQTIHQITENYFASKLQYLKNLVSIKKFNGKRINVDSKARYLQNCL